MIDVDLYLDRLNHLRNYLNAVIEEDESVYYVSTDLLKEYSFEELLGYSKMLSLDKWISTFDCYPPERISFEAYYKYNTL